MNSALYRMLRPLAELLPNSTKKTIARIVKTSVFPRAMRKPALNPVKTGEPVSAADKVNVVTAVSAKTVEPVRLPAHVTSALPPVDLIISPNEISFAHGTGVLISRLIEDREHLITMRSSDFYGGEQRVTAHESFTLPSGVTEQRQVLEEVVEWLKPYKVRSIVCAPYFPTDLMLAIAAKAVTGAPLSLWIMDDNCLKNFGIDRSLMVEAINVSQGLFAISPELKRAYQDVFRKPMAVLPPLVSPKLILTEPSKPSTNGKMVMIGNLWSASLLKKLAKAVEGSGASVDWYSPNIWLWDNEISREKLRKSGLNMLEMPEPDVLSKAVKLATAVIVPTDTTGAGDHAAALGAMSLPTRMPFVLASAGTPLLVVGSENTAAAHFVKNFEVGRVSPYDGAELRKAVEALQKPDVQIAIRKNSAALAPKFSFEGAWDFVDQTVHNGGRWPDERFEELFPLSSSYGIFINKPVPNGIPEDYHEVLEFADRLKGVGFEPDFVIDVGASTAVWSLAVNAVFDKARYILCDPMFSRYEYVSNCDNFEFVEAGVGARGGKAEFEVSDDLYNSSLISVSEMVAVVETVAVPIVTIDGLVKKKKLTGRGLLKVDVQNAEHLVIEGSTKALKECIDVVVLELSLVQVHPDARSLLQVSDMMDGLGFRIYDQISHWRTPDTGELEQMDLVFVRKGLSFTIQDILE